MVQSLVQLDQYGAIPREAGVDPVEDVPDCWLSSEGGAFKFDREGVGGCSLDHMAHQAMPAPRLHAMSKGFPERSLAFEIERTLLKQTFGTRVCQRMMVMENESQRVDCRI